DADESGIAGHVVRQYGRVGVGPVQRRVLHIHGPDDHTGVLDRDLEGLLDRHADELMRIGLGCMRLHPDEAERTIAAATASGITLFDTARAYHGNERVVANA